MDSTALKTDGIKQGRIFFLISAFTFLLLILYAFVHILEFDESWSYMAVKPESVLDLITYKNYSNANNHLLNSLWFKLLQAFGVKNFFIYRSASLLCFPIYAFFLYKATTYNNPSWKSKYDWYLSLFFMPTVIFYFTSGRGYAMAIAFFCGALYYLKVYLDTNKPADFWKFFFMGVISSISIISFFVPFAAMFVYMYLKKYPSKLFTAMNIVSGVLFLVLTGYIYYVGKRVILHDVTIPGTNIGIINGTDNLFVNGMYSTFLSSLSLYYGICAFKDLYIRWHLELISKILLLVTIIPVVLIIARRYIGKYIEILVLILVTLIFFFSHILLKAKYPSDRSVSYLFYLIYIPVIMQMLQSANKFFKVHYFTVLAIGLINFFGFFHELTIPNFYGVMKEKPQKEYTIYSDWPNSADQVTSDFSFNGRLSFTYMAENYEKDTTAIDNNIKLAAANPKADFILIQKLNYLKNKSLFENGFTIQPVISSNSKELYLIQRNSSR